MRVTCLENHQTVEEDQIFALLPCPLSLTNSRNSCGSHAVSLQPLLFTVAHLNRAWKMIFVKYFFLHWNVNSGKILTRPLQKNCKHFLLYQNFPEFTFNRPFIPRFIQHRHYCNWGVVNYTGQGDDLRSIANQIKGVKNFPAKTKLERARCTGTFTLNCNAVLGKTLYPYRVFLHKLWGWPTWKITKQWRRTKVLLCCPAHFRWQIPEIPVACMLSLCRHCCLQSLIWTALERWSSLIFFFFALKCKFRTRILTPPFYKNCKHFLFTKIFLNLPSTDRLFHALFNTDTDVIGELWIIQDKAMI